MEQHLEMLEFAGRHNAASTEHCREPGQVGDKFACSLGSLAVSSGEKENVSILVGILDEGNDRKRLTSGPTLSRWHIGLEFVGLSVDIENHFLSGRLIENKPEV